MASAWSNEGPSEQVVNTSITLTIHPNIKRALPEWHVGVYSTPELTNTLSNIVQSTGSEYVRSIYKELTDEHFSETYATFLPALRWWDYYVKNRFFGEDLSCPRVIEAYHEHTEAFVSVLQTEEQKEYLKLHLRAALEGESEATQLFSDWSTVDIDWLAAPPNVSPQLAHVWNSAPASHQNAPSECHAKSATFDMPQSKCHIERATFGVPHSECHIQATGRLSASRLIFATRLDGGVLVLFAFYLGGHVMGSISSLLEASAAAEPGRLPQSELSCAPRLGDRRFSRRRK